jgi:type IV pilus assembly protein PilB
LLGVRDAVKRGIGELLVDNGQISPEELQQAQEERNKTGEPISKVLFRLGLADENQVKNALELEYGVNYVPLKKLTPDLKTVLLVPEKLVKEHEAIPLAQEGSRLTLAMVTPSNFAAFDVFKGRLASWQIKPVVCSEDDFWDFVTRAYSAAEMTEATHKLDDTKEHNLGGNESVATWRTTGDDDQYLNEPEDMAIILLSNHILSNAIAKGCTNIHIEPTERQVLVHYRKDGVLFAARRLPIALLPALVRRYKKMAAINVSEEGLPQDGRLHLRLAEQELSFRLSIVAGVRGEHLIIWLD